VHGLNIVGVIVPPGAAHATGADVVRDHVGVVGELLLANTANAVLGHDLPVEQLAHLPVRPQLAVPARVLEIVDAPDTQLALMSFPWNCLPAAARQGAVDRTELVAAESHGSCASQMPIAFKRFCCSGAMTMYVVH